MVGNADKKPVMRDIECHCPYIAIFRWYKILVFHGKLITDPYCFSIHRPPRQLNTQPLTTT